MADAVTADRIREFLERSRESEGYSLPEVLTLAEEFAHSAPSILDINDDEIVTELRQLSTFIAQARAEIMALQPQHMKDEQIPSADAELRAVVEHTGEATNAIMAAAEDLMAADPSDAEAYQGLVNDKVMQIFEACSFQDITGQRITKVANILKYIEERIARFATIAGAFDAMDAQPAKEGEDPEMHGPALAHEANDQAAIDALFND